MKVCQADLITLEQCTSGMCGAELFPAGRGGAGRGQKSAGRGGAKERVNRLIQKFDNSAYIVMEIFVVYYDVLIN